MKGKGKKILSLMLALAMVVQLFAGLGEVSKAAGATQITVNGLGGWSDTFANCGTEQIGFETKENIRTDGAWKNYTITSGSIKRNDSTETGWRIQTTGNNTFVLVLNNYQPKVNDIITISAGTQFTENENQAAVYEIVNECSIVYDGTTWHNWGTRVENATAVTITKRDGYSVTGTELEQIGLTVEGTPIVNTGNWDDCDITYGKIYLNDAVQTNWYVYTMPTNQFSLVGQGYTPKTGDVIKIPAGTQFAQRTDSSNVYEIKNTYLIKYDGTTWVEQSIELTLGALNDTTTRVAEGGQGYLYQIGIATNQTDTVVNWNSGTDTTAEVYMNDDSEPTYATALWNTESGELFVQLDLPTDTVVNSITIKTGTQYTILGTTYEVTSEDYTIYCYDGDLHSAPKPESTKLTLGVLNDTTTRIVEGGRGYVYQIGIATNQTDTVVNWNSGTDTTAEVYLNGDSEPTYATALWNTESGELFVQLDLSKSTVVDTIIIKNGTEYTILGTTYEITSGDYTIYCYDGDLHSAPKPESTKLTLGELIIERCVRTEASKGYVYQLYIKTDHFDAPTAWTGNDNNATILLNGSPVTGAVTWDDVANGIFFVQLDLEKATTVNSITLEAGTQYTINNILYEIKEDYTIYHKNGTFSTTMLYDITMTVDGQTTTTTVSGDYTLPESSKEGYITLGWEVNGKLYQVGTELPATIEGYNIRAVYAAFSQIAGAQVRLTAANATEKVGGIRFVSKLGSDSWNDYILQMGMLIMPTNKMTNGELTHENYVETNEQGSTQGYRQFVIDKADRELEVYEADTAANGAEGYYLKSSIVDLYSYNYTRSYSARSFLQVQYADGVEYVYTDYSKDDNARRICDIAKKMIIAYPEKYAPAQSKTYPIVYEYAKVADTMESFAFYGPQVVVTNGEYDVAATKEAMQKYADIGFKYFLCEQGYHVDNTFGTTTLEEERNVYDNPRLPAHNLKQTMQIARECGLDVLVLDWSLNKLSAVDIPLVETSSSQGQLLAMCLETTDGQYPELLGSAIDETKFDESNRTYNYNGSEAKVLHYVWQFKTYDELKNWVAVKMSAYAQEDNFRGIRLDDEPKANQFAAVALMTKVVKELYPNAYVQTSSLPGYTFESGSGTIFSEYNDGHTDWIAYWGNLLAAHQNYQKQSGGLYVSEGGVNFYPYALWKDGVLTWTSYNHKLRTSYLSALQHLANTTKENGISLEMTVQSFAVDELYANVSAADLHLQTNLALAFGTKTMGYFRYTGKGELETAQTDRYINQDIVSDENLQNAILYANKNGNYLKAHMTFFEYEGSKVYGNSTYVTPDGLSQLSSLKKDIITVSGAPVLVNEFYNEYTGQYGYYVVNLAQLNNEDEGGTDIQNPASATITLSQGCLVYKDYNNYMNEEANKEVTTVTLGGGQGAFIVVEE